MLRPINRWISCVRPPMLPRSRAVRVRVARGSIAYSAVIQPSPEPRFQRGTSSSTDAVHNTRVSPKATRQEPSAYGATPRWRIRGRSAVAARSGRGGAESDTEPRDRGSGGVARRERDDEHLAAARAHVRRADDGGLGVVAALHEHVGLEQPDE